MKFESFSWKRTERFEVASSTKDSHMLGLGSLVRMAKATSEKMLSLKSTVWSPHALDGTAPSTRRIIDHLLFNS